MRLSSARCLTRRLCVWVYIFCSPGRGAFSPALGPWPEGIEQPMIRVVERQKRLRIKRLLAPKKVQVKESQ